MSGDERRFYILDVRTIVGNCALWWRPNGQGYTTDLNEAGLYSEAHARAHRETDVAVPEEMARACSQVHVRVEQLREMLDQAGEKWPRVAPAPTRRRR